MLLLFPCLLYPLEWIIWGRGHVRGRRVQLRVELVAWTYQEEAADQLPGLCLVQGTGVLLF